MNCRDTSAIHLADSQRSHGPDAAIAQAWWDNLLMKIAIELNSTQAENLKAIAASLGVNAEDLAQAAVADLVSANADDFESAATRVLEKNRELYRRLAT